jgi:pSer/pThr/pTyr-binding forkhead associated (FHA) protein/ferredoxin/thioredoxin reductase
MSERLPDGRLILDTPARLPDVLDLLVVGGGPVGTACAFRAKELGIAALVIEMDDLMKRIRDYAKEKPILPDYGGGDTMQFPAGGDLVTALQFQPIDKDRMVERWKALYRTHNVPAHIGVELLALERLEGGVWRAETRNHYTKQAQSFLARHVVLGLGRGVPRRLDIPGNVQDLAHRLVDAQAFVGQPACVIGGGTSAAEAVIAISKAKAESGSDESPVFWSHRSRSMPKVSEALAPGIFDAITMHGNLRLALGSEPVALTTRDGTDYLVIRAPIDDRPGPPRDVQLEFARAFCVACIGADRPDPLLRALGADFVPKESGKDDRLVVSPLLEMRHPGLYIAGDLLSPDHAEATDFDADPTTFAIRSRRGNVKAALRDGVLLAEVVRQRLDGKTDIRVVVAPAAVASDEGAKGTAEIPAALRQPSKPGRLVAFLADDTPADEFPLVAGGVTTIGREGTTIVFPQDSMLSKQHASISHGPAGLELRDLGSQNGVFLKVREGRDVPLTQGSIVKVGQQWIVTQELANPVLLVHYDASGKELARHRVAEGTTLVVGRTPPAVVLSRDDGTLSRRHASFSLERGQCLLRDLGSRNGTFIKVDRRWVLEDGDAIWLGHQLLRLQIGDGPASAPAVVSGKAVAAQASTPAPVAAPASGEPSVTFGEGKPLPFGKSGTLLDLALAKRVRIKYECKLGDCGKCRVEVTSGAHCLNPRTSQEDKALRMIGHSEPENRLACLVKDVRGPVVVHVPK